MTTPKFVLNQDTKFRYITIVLLNQIINFDKKFPVLLTGDDFILLDYINYMFAHDLIKIDEVNKCYIASEKGRDYLVNFYAKFSEYLKVFDVYCAVDLQKGEFAFSRMNDSEFENDESWNRFLSEDRFSDVRIAVAEFKKVDPIEIVFMSFVNEGKFEVDKDGWQKLLTEDEIWFDMIEICNTAVSCEYLSKDGVMENVINQGSKLMLELIKKDETPNGEEQEGEGEDTTTETITETTTEYVDMPYYSYDYYQPYYYDPFYISPIWLVPFIL